MALIAVESLGKEECGYPIGAARVRVLFSDWSVALDILIDPWQWRENLIDKLKNLPLLFDQRKPGVPPQTLRHG
jgi:hypothetical protein